MATQVKTGLIANNAITDAKIANVALTGVTASSGDSSTSLATTAFVAGEINSLIDSAPGALNTLNELAAAMGDDANFSTTVTNNIATKLPLAGGTLTGNLFSGNKTGLTDTNTGHAFAPGGLVYHTTAGTIAQSLNRLTNDGPVLRFVGNGTTAGSVGVLSGGLSFGTGTSMTTRMEIDSGGDVKINTGRLGLGMDAAQALDIERTSGLSLRFYNGGSFKAGLQAVDGSGQMIGTSAANDFAIRSQSNLLFSSGGNTERMRIKSGNGHVGIGTTNPRYNLTVEGNNTTAIGIGVDNVSGSSTLDIAALGTGYANHQAAGGEVWFYSPDNINIGGATGSTNNIKFIANNKVNMLIRGDGTGIDTNQTFHAMPTQSNLSSGQYDQIWGQAAKAHGSFLSPYMTLSTRYGSWDANVGCNARSMIGQQSGGTEQATGYGGGGASNLYVGFTSLNWYHWPSSVTNTVGTNLPITSTYQMMVCDSGGNFNINGTYYNNASDRRLKDNITPISSALDKVKKLTGNTFTWKTDDSLPIPEQFVGQKDVGVIAQEVQEVVPEAIGLSPWDIEYKEIDNPDYKADAEPPIPQKIQSKDVSSESGNDYLTVNEEKLVPLLIEAIKELEARVAELEV